MQERYVCPAYELDGFHCPLCNTYAHQHWGQAFHQVYQSYDYIPSLAVSLCQRCKQLSFWHNKALLYPSKKTAPRHHKDLPDNVKNVYNEAREIVDVSPRAAAALLRLAAEILINDLEKSKGDLNDKIGALVKKGLPVQIQQSLDILRVVGNHAVHPGQIRIEDKREMAIGLFNTLNFIVEKVITEPEELKSLYNALPDSAKEQIQKRDAAKEKKR